MYEQFHETFTLPVGLDVGGGSVVREVTLRPLVVGDMPRVAELSGDNPTLMAVDLARWCCQVVSDPAGLITMDSLLNLLEPDYQAFSDAAERVKKKLPSTSDG